MKLKEIFQNLVFKFLTPKTHNCFRGTEMSYIFKPTQAYYETTFTIPPAFGYFIFKNILIHIKKHTKNYKE